MKKYITIAALLAAGTAFANADQNLTIDSNTTGNFDQLSGKNGNKVCNITVEEDATITRIDGSSINNLTTISLTLVDDADLTITNYAKLPYNCTNATYNTSVTLGENSNLSVGNQLYFGTRNAQNTEITMNTSILFSDGSKITAGSIETVASAGGTSSLEVSLVYTTDMLVDNYVRTLITTTSGFTNFGSTTVTLASISDLDNQGYENAGVIASEAALKAGQYGLVFSSSGTTMQFVSAAPVPEPSAFGLLAGMGALALVASRRRRK